MKNIRRGRNKGGASINLLGLLGVCFIVLKLCEVITWSWWWVTCPFWGGAVVVIGIFAIIALIALIVAICKRD